MGRFRLLMTSAHTRHVTSLAVLALMELWELIAIAHLALMSVQSSIYLNSCALDAAWTVPDRRHLQELGMPSNRAAHVAVKMVTAKRLDKHHLRAGWSAMSKSNNRLVCS